MKLSLRNLCVLTSLSVAGAAVGCSGADFSASPGASSGAGGTGEASSAGSGAAASSAGSSSTSAGATSGGSNAGGSASGGAPSGGSDLGGASGNGNGTGGTSTGAGGSGAAGTGASGHNGGGGGGASGVGGAGGSSFGGMGAVGGSSALGGSGGSSFGGAGALGGMGGLGFGGGVTLGGSGGMAGGGGCTAIPWYPDGDGDLYGRSSGAVLSCTAPNQGKWVSQAGDCDDDNKLVNPVAGYFSDGYTPAAGGTSFDYNCSGIEEEDPTQLGAAPACNGLLGLGCTGSGFQPTSRTGPGVNSLCGSKTLVTCTTVSLSCTAVLSTVTDGVRCH